MSGGWHIFTIVTELIAESSDREVSRTYEEFQNLRELMVQEFPFCAVPLLPEISQWLKIKALDSPEIAQLKVQMSRFLEIVCCIPRLNESFYFKKFLTVNPFNPD